MSSFKSVLAVLLLGLVAMAAANYCSVCKDHTLCKFTSTSAGSACKNFKSSALTKADKDALVKAHNTLRNKVALGQESRGNKQPTAANMRKMEWDDELATIAQRWANQCNFAHDSCRSTLDGTYSGQNIFWEASSGPLSTPNWNKPVQDWYDEVQDREGSLNTIPFKSTSGPVVGHYTQVAWAKSYKVGCGYSQYTEVQGGTTWYARLVVCNYKPGGNFIGQTMYEAGAPASKCPSGTKKDSTYKGLCA